MSPDFEPNGEFAHRVYALVADIPKGRVMTYGQIAALCGSARAARIVGGVAHYGPVYLPWHRVVNKKGGLASGYHGGRMAQKEHLESEGVVLMGKEGNYFVNLRELLWEPKNQRTPLIVILGPTASGKSALALSLAERYKGELICADSRTVYRNMDIGTAKPTKEEQQKVLHHLLDIRNPNEAFNVGEFKRITENLIDDISKRGKLPIIVGGTGLYIDSVLFDFGFSKDGSEKDEQNPRHLKKHVAFTDATLRSNTLIIGLDVPKDILNARIKQRIATMIELGLEREVKALADTYGWHTESMTGVGYREWQAYFTGSQTREETEELIMIHTRQYAKRQRSWFMRNKYIYWISTPDAAHNLVMTFLQRNK